MMLGFGEVGSVDAEIFRADVADLLKGVNSPDLRLSTFFIDRKWFAVPLYRYRKNAAIYSVHRHIYQPH